MPKATSSDGAASFGEVDWKTPEVQGLEAYGFSDRVIENLDRLGIGNRERPTVLDDHVGILPGLKAGQYFDGRLPTVIRRLSLDQLSALYSLFSNWYAYLHSQLRRFSAIRSEKIRQKEFIWSMVRQQYRYYDDATDGKQKKRTDQQMSDAARQDFRFVKASAEYEEYNCIVQCMEGMLEVAELDMKVISREVTIQQNKMMADINEGNIGKRASAGYRRMGERGASSGKVGTDGGKKSPPTKARKGRVVSVTKRSRS